MNLDEALAEMKRIEAAINTAAEAFKAEQAAGRFGVDPYQRWKRLEEEATTLSAAIAARMDEVLASL